MTAESSERDTSGLRSLFRNQSDVPVLLDTLLSLPERKELSKQELASEAGVSRQTVSKYVGTTENPGVFLDTGVLEVASESRPERYRVADGPVVGHLRDLSITLSEVTSEN